MDECVASEWTRGKVSGFTSKGCRCWKCSTATSVYSACHRALNHEAYRQRRAQYRDENREKLLAEDRKYREENRALIRAREQERNSDPLVRALKTLLAQRRRTERQLAVLGVEGYADGS